MAGGAKGGAKLGHALPNGGRGGMWSKGGGSGQRESERVSARRSVRVRNLERPDNGGAGSGRQTAHGEPSPVYRDRRSLTRRGRQLMEKNIHASWRAFKNDGEMVIVSAVAVCLLAYVATTLDLQAMAAGLLQRLPPETVLAGMLRWQSLELGCWGAAALLLAFFTWLLYAALFDTVGMVAGVAPAVAAAICVFVVRVTPFLCDDLRGGGASQQRFRAEYCELAAGHNPRLLLGTVALVAFTSAALSALATFALRQRLPGPDRHLAMLSTATLAAIAATASSAPESWEVVQQAAQWLAAVEEPVSAAAYWQSWAHFETGVWAAGAILIAFFCWLLFAAMYDEAGMAWGVAPAAVAATWMVTLRVMPAACKAEQLLHKDLHPHLCRPPGEVLTGGGFLTPAVAATLLLLAGSSIAAHTTHKSRARKVLVVHGSPRRGAGSGGATTH